MAGEKSFHIDPTAIVHPSVTLGEGSSIWNWTKVREGVKIGRHTNIGQNVYVDFGVVIGDHCKVQNSVNLYHGVTIGDRVFIGPHASFTNDIYPRAVSPDWEVVPTRIEDGASIGANATIVCGVTLGKNCMVAAGSVVTQNVPAFGLVIGQPAKLVDYVNIQGRPLHHNLQGPAPSDEKLHTVFTVPQGDMDLKAKSRVRVGVVGAGVRGREHLRILDLLKNVEIAGVMDPNKQWATEAAMQYNCPILNDISQFVGQADAVCIASPLATHAEYGVFLLDHNIHCLIEKPLASTEAECLALLAAAERNNRVLLAGYVERFNPAVRQLTEILAHGNHIYAVDVRRMSAVNDPRTSDLDVVLDLMGHDLDIVLSLIQSPVTSVAAHSVRPYSARADDYVTALITFANGSIANLTASRITQNKVRELRLTTDLGYITLDYGTQELLIYRQGAGAIERSKSPKIGSYSMDLSMERVLIRPGEPMTRELRHFIEAVRGKKPPLVTGQQALDNMRLAWQIKKSCEPPQP
ncbi:MAG: Gfo/Idh/MocA family oxidoreductase [Magnetococcales bacterium]|nr:Gfo/Idh/MocA family oxidoreductase [Magnetococcales bacterium]MBF0322718.1 Gfo/Idh/MocA family oxidoreductase [Magnetococcales bacterium]